MHDADFPHDHPSDTEFVVDIEGLEMFTLTSVGIDIGSSTSHLVFSRLTLRREGPPIRDVTKSQSERFFIVQASC